MTEVTNALRRGTAVARGEFVLDEAQAREKLREFQLVNPNYYILEFIKVAHLLGATEVDFKIDADEMEMRFNGAVHSPSQLDRLHSAPFSQRGDASSQALRHLAIGVHAAQGIGLAELRIEVRGKETAVYRLEGEEVERVEVQSPLPAGTRIYLRERRRPGHLLRFVESMRGRLSKVAILKERCRFARLLIVVNGEMISAENALPTEARSPVEFDNGSERGKLGITLSDKVVRTRVVHNGVFVSVHQRVGEAVGARVIIDSSRLTLNLSQSAFVEDAAWAEIQGVVDDAMLDSLTRLLNTACETEANSDQRFLEELKPVVVAVLQKLSPDTPHTNSVRGFLKAVETLPLFLPVHLESRGEERWSIAQARTTDPDKGQTSLLYTRVFTPEIHDRIETLSAPILYLPYQISRRGHDAWDHFADECTDLTSSYALRQENHKRWQRGRPYLPIGDKDQLIERVGGLEVHVSWTGSSTISVELCYVLESGRWGSGKRLLSRKTAQGLGVNGLSIHIIGEFEPDWTFSTAKIDARIKAAWDLVPRLIVRMIGARPRPEAIQAIAEERLYRGINEVAGFEVWTPDSGLFSDVNGRKWSLRALGRAFESGRFRRLLYVAAHHSARRLISSGELLLLGPCQSELQFIEALFKGIPIAEVSLTRESPGWTVPLTAVEEVSAEAVSVTAAEEVSVTAAEEVFFTPVEEVFLTPANEASLPWWEEEEQRRTESGEREREQNWARWQTSPWWPNWADDVVFAGQTQDTLNVTVVWGGAAQASSLVYIKEGRVLRSEPMDMRVRGMLIAISGEMEANDVFDAPAPSARIERAKTLGVELACANLEQVLGTLSRRRRLTLLGALLSGEFEATLKRAMQWSRWPEELTQWRPAFTVKPVPGAELMSMELFKDVYGRRWCLEELFKRSVVVTILPTEIRRPTLQADIRLQDEAVLIADIDVTRVLTALNVQTVPATDFLDKLEREAELKREAELEHLRLEEARKSEPPPMHRRFLASVQDQLAAAQRWPLAPLCWPLEMEWESGLPDAGLRPTARALNGNHPAVQHALAHPDDAVALAFVTSALYGLVGVTSGREEVDFLEGLSAITKMRAS